MKTYTPPEGVVNATSTKKDSNKKKDPNAPKKVRNSYILFCSDTRAEIKEANPNMTSKEIISELGRRWRELSLEEKQPYIDSSAVDKQRYVDETAKYTPPGVEKEETVKGEVSSKEAEETVEEEVSSKEAEAKKKLVASKKSITKKPTKSKKSIAKKLDAIEEEIVEEEEEEIVEEEEEIVEEEEEIVEEEEKNCANIDELRGKVMSELGDKKKGAYVLFCEVMRPLVIQSNPELKGTALTKELSNQWGRVSIQEKRKWKRWKR
jgi:hypothetical protein